MSLRGRDQNLAEALRMGFKPQRSCRAGRIEPKPLPPRRFIPVTVNFAMVSPAQRHREFVTDLAAERPVLRKPQMVGFRPLSAVSKPRLAHLIASKSRPAFLAISYSSLRWQR
jgi:hypothetical protein